MISTDNNGNCINVVQMVTYTFTYFNPIGILTADVNIQFTNTPLTSSFQQTFKAVFQPNSTTTVIDFSFKIQIILF